MDNSSNEEQDKKLQSRYSMVIAVAKRTKQIREGSPVLVDCKSANPITCAMEEIAQGKIKMVAPTPEEMEEQQHEAVAKPEIKKTAELLKVPDQFDIEDADIDLEGEELSGEEDLLGDMGEGEETASEEDVDIETDMDAEEDAG